jgi:hypothetical protein
LRFEICEGLFYAYSCASFSRDSDYGSQTLSEDKLEPQLNVSPWRRAGDFAEGSIRTREVSEGDPGVVEVRLVEGVEKIRLELKLCAFGDVE